MFINNFDFANGFNVLRIMCGAFFIPHIFSKFTEREFTLGFFTEAGFKPPELWVYAAMATEVVVTPALILGIYTNYVAGIAAIYLIVACGSLYRVSHGRWYWNFGGFEYCFFWAICCIIVALYS